MISKAAIHKLDTRNMVSVRESKIIYFNPIIDGCCKVLVLAYAALTYQGGPTQLIISDMVAASIDVTLCEITGQHDYN
jgi:hypothetical protein